MTVEGLVTAVAQDKVALIFLFLLLPCMALLMNKLTSLRGVESPYTHIYSGTIYIACICGILSLCIWVHTAIFQVKSLIDLNFFIYYLPIISMIATLIIIKKQIRLSQLPWYGEFYELVVLLFIAFGATLLIMEYQWLQFGNAWYVLLFSGLIFGVLKTIWERLARVR